VTKNTVLIPLVTWLPSNQCQDTKPSSEILAYCLSWRYDMLLTIPLMSLKNTCTWKQKLFFRTL